MEMELGGGFALVLLAKQPMDCWATISDNPNSYAPGSPRMEPWTDGEPMFLTSDLLRDPNSIKCHASLA